MRKATVFPSGEKRGEPGPDFSSVSTSASPPCRGRRQSGGLPPRADTNTSHLPSGDQDGWLEDFSPRVSCCAPEPSAPATQIWLSHSLFSPSICTEPTV